MEKRKNKHILPRICSLIGVLVVLCSMVLPASAVTFVDDSAADSDLINVGRFTIAGVADSYLVPYAYATIADDGSTGSISYSFYSSDPDDYESIEWNCQQPSLTGGAYRAYQSVYLPGGNWQNIAFQNSTPFVITADEWDLLMNLFTVRIPADCVLTFSASFTGYYPVEQSEGGFKWTRLDGSYTYEYSLDDANSVATPVPFLYQIVGTSEFDSMFDKGIYCTDICFTVDLFSRTTSIGYISYSMPYQDPVNCVRLLDYFRQYPKESVVQVVVEDLNAANVGAFLASAAGGFFEVEIIPGLSLGAVLAAVIGVLILVAFLKLR